MDDESVKGHPRESWSHYHQEEESLSTALARSVMACSSGRVTCAACGDTRGT